MKNDTALVKQWLQYRRVGVFCLRSRPLISVSARLSSSPLTSSQESPYQSTLHNKMQRRAPTHDVGLYLSPECPWHSSSQLALHHPRALAVLSAHHHINQHRLSHCGWCELRDQILLDIVRASCLPLLPINSSINGSNTGNPLDLPQRRAYLLQRPPLLSQRDLRETHARKEGVE